MRERSTGFSALMVVHIVLPLVFLSAVFTMINSITEKDYVKKLAGFLRKGTIFLTGFAVTVFTGIAAIQGMVTKAADGILINTTKFSLDNFVPIVGGFAADSLDMLNKLCRADQKRHRRRRNPSDFSIAGDPCPEDPGSGGDL